MSQDDAPYVVAITTLGSVEEAREFVRALVDRRLVACGTLLPGAKSIYRWEGKVAEETEVVVLLKTRGACWADLLEATRALHPYKVPELLALPVGDGLSAYLDWLTSETLQAE